MNEHTQAEHHHSHHKGHEHTHEHTHDYAASPALEAWKALCACVTAAGIMDMQEITAALTAQQRKQRKKKAQPEMIPMPYILTAMPGQPPTAALRWEFDSRCTREFVDWCTTSLRERFGINWQIEYEDEDAQLGPQSLRIIQGERQERCDWHYLNQSHWMGAFCTIADRLLEPLGITALSLETGWFDTVVVFCRKQYADELLNWFPEAE
jgi:hypothetical protein